MKFERRGEHGVRCTYDIVDATEELLASLRRSSLGEKIAVERHLHSMWNDTDGSERVLIAAIVNALELPRRS